MYLEYMRLRDVHCFDLDKNPRHITYVTDKIDFIKTLIFTFRQGKINYLVAWLGHTVGRFSKDDIAWRWMYVQL